MNGVLDLERFVPPATNIPRDTRWEVQVDGQEVDAQSVDLISPIGVGIHARYGESPAAPGAYAQVVLQKPGGATTALICEHTQGGVLIGVIGQKRPLVYPDAPDTLLLTLPGGFISKGETANKAAQQELQEEAGIVGIPRKSRGSHTHMERTFVCYTGDDYDEFFYMIVPEGQLEGPVKGRFKNEVWRYKSIVSRDSMPQAVENITQELEFVPAEWLLDNTVDAYTKLGLYNALFSLGKINFS